MKRKIAKVLRFFGYIWLSVAMAVIGFGYLTIIIQEGLAKFYEIVSPFNLVNAAAVIVTLGPGLLALWGAERLSRHSGTQAIDPRNNGVKGEMNLKRLATILGGTLCLIAMLGLPYLYVRGWHHPLAKVLGVYHHKVSTWEELCEVLSGKDIYEKYSARVLSYKCEDIRNSVAETFHRARVEDTAAFLHAAPDDGVVRELERLKMTGAWRNENTLHLSYETADDYQFKQITKEFTKLVTTNPESNVPEERCIPLSVQGLFEEVILHGPHGTIRLETANRESPCSVGSS